MITLRRTEQRHHDERGKREGWLTFDVQAGADSLADGFGTLQILNEDRLPPRASIPRLPQQNVEIITYVREGALSYEDSLGRSGVIHAGEFQRITTERRVRHSQSNASRTDSAHVFQIGLCPSETGFASGHEQRRFSVAERRGGLRVVASSDARGSSLRIHQDVVIYSALLDRGQHVVHELSQGRSAWLHVVSGEVTFGDTVLAAGDGAGITTERAVSLTARKPSEILLFDLVGPA